MAYSPAENLYLSALTELQFPRTLQQDEVQAAADAGETAVMEPIKLAQAPTKTMTDAGGGRGSYAGFDPRQDAAAKGPRITGEIKPIDPTIRQQLADFMQAGFERVGMNRYKARQTAQTLMGGDSSNLPLSLGLADIVPFLGTALQTQEAVRMGEEAVQSAQRGDIGTAALQAGGAAVGMIPGAVGTVKAARKVGGMAGEAIDQAMTQGAGPAARIIPQAVRPLNVVPPGQRLVGNPISVDKVQRSKNYKTWSEGADVKTDAGKPKVLYHATTHDFDTFSLERANPENHYGKGFYLTDSVDDANANYAGVGPDLKQRIELRSERLVDEFADMDEQDVMESIQSAGVDMNKYFAGGKTFADLDSKQTNEVLMAVAESELKNHDGMIMPVFAKMKNPVKVGTKNETVFSIETKFDDAGDVINESGNGIDLINAIREVADEYNLSEMDIERAMSKIGEEMYDGIKAGDVDRILRSEINDIYTPDGEYAGPGQFIADVFQRMGFDGIEMNAEKYFGARQGAFGTKLTGMEGVKGATHYILFDSRNIKSAIGNRGTFDPKDPNILHGAGAATAGTGAATMQDKEQK